MITAVDANVILNLLLADDRHPNASKAQMMSAYGAGALISSEIAIAESVPAFGDRDQLDRALREINVPITPLSADIACEAGLRWTQYRRVGGLGERKLPDFLNRRARTVDRRYVADPGLRVLQDFFPGDLMADPGPGP